MWYKAAVRPPYGSAKHAYVYELCGLECAIPSVAHSHCECLMRAATTSNSRRILFALVIFRTVHISREICSYVAISKQTAVPLISLYRQALSSLPHHWLKLELR
jgi:hypothetical protein